MSFASRRLFASVATLALAVTAASPTLAQTCPLEPLANAGPGAQQACPCFVAGERVGVVFEAPPEHYPIEIEKIRISWGSVFGGSPAVLEQALEIYPAGLPSPGAPQFSVAGPQLTDGFVNEFDISFFPGDRVINSGEFMIALQIANAQSILSPSVVSVAPCAAGRNAVFAIPGGWSDACTLGVTGNWVFEVDYRIANCESLNRDVATLSLATGGSQELTLAAGTGAAGWFYWMFGSITGTTPGITFAPGVNLPLNFDAFFNLTLTKPFLGIFGNFIGFLSAIEGTGTSTFSIPPGADPSLSGLVINFAYLASPTIGGSDFASNAKSVTLTM